MLQLLSIESFDREDHLLFSAIDDQGVALDLETCEKLFHCSASVEPCVASANERAERLVQEAAVHAEATVARSLEQNSRFFNEERERLEKWADDVVLAAENDLHDTKEQIKSVKRQARLATTLREQEATQRQVRDLEKKLRRQRQCIFDVEDEVAVKRDKLIDELQKRMSQATSVETLFTIKWSVI